MNTGKPQEQKAQMPMSLSVVAASPLPQLTPVAICGRGAIQSAQTCTWFIDGLTLFVGCKLKCLVGLLFPHSEVALKDKREGKNIFVMNRDASGNPGTEGDAPEVRLCRDSWAEIIVWLAGQPKA